MGVKLTLPAAALLSQVAKLGSLLALLLLALLLPAFLRVAYGYLLFNGIVLALGIQAFVGGTASIADDEDRNGSSSTGQAVAPVGITASPFQRAGSVRPDDDDHVVVPAFVASNIIELKIKTKEVVLKVLKKCPSTASIFFLSALNGSQAGGEEKVRQEEEEDCEVDVDGDVRMSRQELFANTERFIGNFRRELSMQRQ
uniref:Freezing-induced 1 n=1 Tax=Leymus chinensis TaxID=52714 RepID=A0A0K0N4A2_LEYCH|nr:freezing-induced 1 [Leymus chinensis]